MQVTSFPEGVTRSIPPSPAVVHRLLKVAQQGSRARALPLCAWKTAIAQQTCVTCLRADRWVCSKRSSRTPTRDTICVFETVLEIIAPRSFCYTHSRFKGSRTQVDRMTGAVPSSSRMSSSAPARVEHLPLGRSPTTGRTRKVGWSLPVFRNRVPLSCMVDCETRPPASHMCPSRQSMRGRLFRFSNPAHHGQLRMRFQCCFTGESTQTVDRPFHSSTWFRCVRRNRKTR